MVDNIILTFKTRWKIFLLSLVVQLILTALFRFGIESPKALNFLLVGSIMPHVSGLVSPLPRPTSIMDKILPKLKQKPNNFFLQRPTSIVSPALAAASQIQASSYIVANLASDQTGQILLEKDKNSKVPMASLAKIMTAVVALDLATPGDQFTVSNQAALAEPTKIGVVAGQKMTLDELLNAVLLTSANDGAAVIKDGVNQQYGGDVFIQAMNEKAKVLGLKSTHFNNEAGFDSPSQYSTASDLAILSAYALNNYPQIREIVKKDYRFLPQDQNHKQFDLYNWNGLLGVYPGVYGVKIGNTDGAGYTTVVVAERDGTRVLVVLLGAPGVLERDLWAAELLDQGFSQLGLPPVEITESALQTKYSTWQYFN
ncbi:D-alanyl-D-alanine carboxypeptidase [Candidatus Daviesbacteria bacterium]|nr:D-alanyl-D-alanine carboxypeptidase [Candidatus Daviesbacteria bacterium]